MNTKYHQTEGFKFPAAGLNGLDAGTKASVSKFLRQRERDLNTFETAVITCEGGPFNGQSLELECSPGATYSSAEFCIGAWRGHYVGAKWVSTLEADAPAPETVAAPLPHPKINCDLPAKGFDQLRDLLGEMSINPLERETTIKTRDYSNHFKYGKTDDFGDTVEAIERPGSYSIVQTVHSYKTINRKKIPVWTTAIENHPSQGNTWAIDDFGYLFQTTHRQSEREHMTEKRQFVTYKIGRTSYTIPATIEAVERLAAKILKIKKWHADKLLPAAAWARRPIDTAAQVQPVAIVIDTPPSPAVKIEQPAKPLELVKIDYSNAALSKEQLEGKIALFSKMRDDAIATIKTGRLSPTTKENLKSKVIARQIIIDEAQSELNSRNTPPALTPEIEQPAKPLTPQPATTCNPDAIRLRAKATICRAANRPTWAEKLEAQADALERIEQPEPPEPPPGIKPKTDTPPSLSATRQRPHKTACKRIVKIRHYVRHPARHLGSRILSQKYGHPVRQKLMHHRAERPVSNSYEPPAIKTVTPSGNFYNPNRAQTHATPTI